MPVLANEWVYALRTLRRSPRFTIAAGLTLALGIGANTAIFSVVNAVYLRPLPYAQPDRLAALWETAPQGGRRRPRTNSSPAAFLAWRGDRALFEAVGAWKWDVVTLSGAAYPERLQVQRIAGDYLRALGVQPALGRAFLPEEERGTACAVLVSARLWRNWLGADPRVAGKFVLAEGAPCMIAGVMPDGFVAPAGGASRVDAWMPLPLDAAQAGNRTDHSLLVLARLARGVTFEQAQHRLAEQAQQAARSLPEAHGWGARIAPLQNQIAGRPNQALFLLAAAVGFLLLIACLNVATLLTARAAGQRREIAIRSALGAGRRHLVGHLLTQTVLLALLGGAGGLLATYWSMHAMVALAHGALPRLDEAGVDWRVLAFTALLSIATGIAFGLAPAFGITRVHLRDHLNRRGSRRVLRNAQMAAEVALAFILLVGAGLLMRSLHAILAVDLGFRTEHILSANFALPPSHYTDPQRYLQFLNATLERVRGLPGVLDATVTMGVPMVGSAGGSFEIFGRPGRPGERLDAEFRPADAHYFATLGITLDHGRAITCRDLEGAPRVALVNQKAAWQFFGADPIGQQVRVASKGGVLPWMTVVGVVRNTHHTGPLRDAAAEIYFPYAQFRSSNLQPRALVVRTIGDPEQLLPTLQRAVSTVDRDQPLVSVRTMQQNLADFIAPQRFDAALMAVFAVIGLALATIGIFGVMSYRVAQRTHDIGVRMALGARRRDVLGLVLGEAMRTAAAGLALGWAGAWALTRYVASLLFGIRPGDPFTLGAVSALVLFTAAAAAYLPARRACRVDPILALKED